MKKIFSILGTMIFVLSLSGIAGATTFTFQPSDPDLGYLVHQYAYTWGIGLEDWEGVPGGEEIVGASLFFDNICNWDNNDNQLWVHLLDDVAVGVTSFVDSVSGDEFGGMGNFLGDFGGLTTTQVDIMYDFEPDEIADLNAFAPDGKFGFGFDPDCHFYNDGITLTITTAVIPEPATILLVGCGLLGVAAFGRKRLKK